MSDRKSSDSTQERNQCDGCQRGLPVRHSRITMDETPLHYDQDTGIVVMACTSDRYNAESGLHMSPAVAAPDRGDAVNLARNVADGDTPLLSDKGARLLAEAVLQMDAWIREAMK